MKIWAPIFCAFFAIFSHSTLNSQAKFDAVRFNANYEYSSFKGEIFPNNSYGIMLDGKLNTEMNFSIGAYHMEKRFQLTTIIDSVNSFDPNITFSETETYEASILKIPVRLGFNLLESKKLELGFVSGITFFYVYSEICHKQVHSVNSNSSIGSSVEHYINSCGGQESSSKLPNFATMDIGLSLNYHINDNFFVAMNGFFQQNIVRFKHQGLSDQFTMGFGASVGYKFKQRDVHQEFRID